MGRWEIGQWVIGFDGEVTPTIVIIRKNDDDTFTAVGDLRDDAALCIRHILRRLDTMDAALAIFADVDSWEDDYVTYWVDDDGTRIDPRDLARSARG